MYIIRNIYKPIFRDFGGEWRPFAYNLLGTWSIPRCTWKKKFDIPVAVVVRGAKNEIIIMFMKIVCKRFACVTSNELFTITNNTKLHISFIYRVIHQACSLPLFLQ